MIGQSYYDKVNELCDKLRQRRIIGSYAAAKGTADLLRQLASSSKAQSAQMLLEEVRSVGVRIQSARPIGTFLVSDDSYFVAISLNRLFNMQN